MGVGVCGWDVSRFRAWRKASFVPPLRTGIFLSVEEGRVRMWPFFDVGS
jgi:hypothetical protein